MPKQRSRRTHAKNQADRVRTLLGGTPPAALRNKPMPLEAELKAGAKLRRERWALVSRHSEPILKSFHNIIAADKRAVKAAQALKNLKPPKRQKPLRQAAPKIAPLTRAIRSGSILTFVSTPYGDSWTAGSGPSGDSTTFGTGEADANTGFFGPECVVGGSGGSEWGGAGVALWFQPVADHTLVRFSPWAQCVGIWDDQSWGWATAHTNGKIAILIESWDLNGQNYTIDVNRQLQQWSDGIGSWSDEHGYYQPNSINFPADTFFLADASRWYRVWTWAEVWCDGSGSGGFWGSTAFGNFACNLVFCVFEQFT
jgi:hypothetical protein